jgi:glycosyltransferase involved in cell wall biosynthesis
VLVIDNNSTDHTRAVVEEFTAQRPSFRWIRETKQGLDHARNCAILHSRGEVIAFGDDDILVEPDWLSQLCEPLLGDGQRKIGAVGGEVIPVFPDGLPEWVREWHAPLAFRPDTGPLEPPHSPMGANLAFPKWLFQQVGMFHTELDRAAGNYFSGGDGEMIRRVRIAGLQVWFAPGAAVKHQMPASRTTFRYARRHAFDSARSRVIDRAGQPGSAGYLAGRFVANIAKAVGFAILALLQFVLFQTGPAKKSLVRAWRSCGYLYQIPRSLAGTI